MKTRIFTSLLLIAVSLCGFAQDKASLKTAMLRMIDFSEKQDYKSIVDFTYPKIFTKVSKEEYLKQVQNNAKGDDYAIFRVKTDPAIDYDAIVRNKNGFFCIIHHNTLVNVNLKNKIDKKDRPELINRFKKILNTKDVYYNEASNSLTAKNRVETIAIFDDATKGRWTFIDPTNPYANDVLNQDIKNALDPNYVAPVERQNKPGSSNAPLQNQPKTPLQKATEEKAALEKKLNSKNKKS